MCACSVVCVCALCVVVSGVSVCVGAGVGVHCVVSVVCVRGVCGAAGHAENLPCAGSKRLRVWVQDASVCTGKTRACVQHARVLHEHTEAFSNLHTGTF